MFHNNYYISKDDIHITRTDFGNSVSYGSRFQSIFIGHNTYKSLGEAK